MCIRDRIANEEIPSCMEKVKEYKRCREAVWDKESKIYGFEVLDIRIGGLLARDVYKRQIIRRGQGCRVLCIICFTGKC